MLHFVDVDEENWRIPLKVKADQAHWVSDRTKLLARAYAYRNARARAFFICDEEVPVGMGLYYDYEPLKGYDLSQLFIDENYQGKGYGKAATGLILDCMKADGKYQKVVLCYIEGNEAAKHLYESFGFAETGRDEDEIIMELELCAVKKK